MTTTWHEDFGKWLVAMPTRKQRRRSVLTLQAYLRDVRLFAEWFEQANHVRFSPDLLNDVDVQTYFDALERKGKPATYNRKLASMRMLISWAMSTGQLDHDPAGWISFLNATRESPRDVLRDEREKLEQAAEARQAINSLGLRDRLMFELMNSAGLRISEVVGLQLDDLHLEDGYIHVLGKGQKHRKVRVGSKLAQLINMWIKNGPRAIEGTVVTDMFGMRMGRENAWRRFQAIAQEAGVKTTPHAMRHTYVYRYMEAYMAGDQKRLPAAIDAVCQQTGDRPEVILQYYTRARESDIRAAAEAL